MSTAVNSPFISGHGETLLRVAGSSQEARAALQSALARFRRQEPMKHEFAHFVKHRDGMSFQAFYLGVEELASKRMASSGELFRMGLGEYAMLLAVAAASRSEDPSRKTGACALDSSGRCIATAYNGLAAGTRVDFTWWDDDDNRRTKVIHAEQNLVSLTKRGEVDTVAVTLLPCGSCARLLAAHGVKTVLYGREYRHDADGKEILAESGVRLEFLSAQGAADNLKNTLPYIL